MPSTPIRIRSLYSQIQVSRAWYPVRVVGKLRRTLAGLDRDRFVERPCHVAFLISFIDEEGGTAHRPNRRTGSPITACRAVPPAMSTWWCTLSSGRPDGEA